MAGAQANDDYVIVHAGDSGEPTPRADKRTAAGEGADALNGTTVDSGGMFLLRAKNVKIKFVD